MLDPADWQAFAALAHRSLDEALERLRTVREQPVWRPIPDEVKARLREPLPQEGTSVQEVYETFTRDIAPYAAGNVHPRWFGWVQGTGTPQGALADLLAATMNSNAGGREHAAVYVERAVIAWFNALFGFPDGASGILVAGTSAANLVALLVARAKALGKASRVEGIAGARLTAYASTATHGCVRKAFEVAGLGSAALRVLPTGALHRLDPSAVREAVARDRSAGFAPFLVVGNAGTVDTGAIDPLDALADLACEERMWFHVDGAFGALAYLAPSLRPLLRGIERADSIAFDFHKWLHVPYDAGCVLVRDGELHRSAFSADGHYLTRAGRGPASGSPWFADYGIDLSRGFRALKVWFTIKEHGAARLGEAIARNCEQARTLAALLKGNPAFEILAPVALNVVCFRYRPPGTTAGPELDRFTEALILRVCESGEAVLSATTVGGRRAIRVCIVNHRTCDEDLSHLVRTIERLAKRREPYVSPS